MIKNLERIRNEYMLSDGIEMSYTETLEALNSDLNNINWIKSRFLLDNAVLYANKQLPVSNSEIEEYLALEERIIDGYEFNLKVLIGNINEYNYEKINKLRRFITSKFTSNILNVESIKKEIALSLNYPSQNFSCKNSKLREDSLFTELFFVEKIKEIAKVNLLQLKK